MLAQWMGPTLRELDRMSRTMDALAGLDGRHGLNDLRWAGYPEVRVQATDDGWTITAQVPGAKAEDVEITAENGTLSLQVVRRLEVPEGYDAVRTERRSWRLARSWRLPRGVDPDGVVADLSDGLLEIRVPKAAELQPRRIEITTTEPTPIEES